MKRGKRNEDDISEEQLNSSEGFFLDTSVSTSLKTIENVAGKIKKLQMTNFMCHSNLELEFNSRVNFITGRNGSGKSAIVAALIAVLGGSTSLTGRGSLISDFIKKGENWAKVSITLINDGIQSYKREVYGSSITICRSISKSSTSHQSVYTCKSEAGAVISKKKEEVDNIIQAFNLQIKNPICVLNQDVARTFLCSTDKSLRFNMFMKATQLEDLAVIHFEILKSLTESMKVLKVKEEGIEEAGREINQLVEKLEHFASLEKRVRERTNLENEYVWSLVFDEEAKLSRLKNRSNDLINKKNEYLAKEGNFENVVKSLEEDVKKYQVEMKEMKSCRDENINKKGEIEKRLKSFAREAERTEIQLKGLLGKKEKKLAEIKGVKEYLQQDESLASQSQAERSEANKKINTLRERLSEIKDELNAATKELSEARETKYQHSGNEERLKTDLGQLEQNKRRLETLLRGTKDKAQSNVLKYGLHTQDLLQAIEEASNRNQFHRKPVGPCGMYVTLSGDPKWASAVESVIGRLMTSYCCDNSKDFQVLSCIMDRICGNKQPSVIISKFHSSRHNVESQKVSHRSLCSVLDVLKFNHDVVFNTFVDQARIERILLFETDGQAASILSHIQNVPKNLEMGLTLQGDQYFPAPNYRTYCGNSARPLRYFESLSKGNNTIGKYEAELKGTCREIQEINSRILKAKQDYARACEVVGQSEMKTRQLRQNESKIQLELNQLRDIEESRPVAKTKVVLEEELQSLEKTYEEFLVEINRCQKSIEDLNDKKKECALELNNLSVREVSIEKNLSKLEDELEKKKLEHRRLLKERDGSNNKLADVNNELKGLEVKVKESEAALAEKSNTAEEVCPERIRTRRSPVEVQKLLEECETYLKAAEKTVGSREATIAEYKRKIKIYKEMKCKSENLSNAVKNLVNEAYQKDSRRKILQSHTASIVSFYFQAILQTRGYDGQLKVDFDNRILDIEVRPKVSTIARKDSKTLSGGERSYSTVSFILAIWKVIGMPFYFLDEFDVFMDKLNRKVIMELLLQHANDQSNEQFVFITPQDISGVQTSNKVSVYRLPDPERKANE